MWSSFDQIEKALELSGREELVRSAAPVGPGTPVGLFIQLVIPPFGAFGAFGGQFVTRPRWSYNSLISRSP